MKRTLPWAGLVLFSLAGAAHAANIKNVNWVLVLSFCGISLILLFATLIYILARPRVPIGTKLLWALALVVTDTVTLFMTSEALSVGKLDLELPFVYILVLTPGTLLARACRDHANRQPQPA